MRKRIVRLNAKMTSLASTLIAIDCDNVHSVRIGDKIALTFLNTIEFNFLKKTVLLHTANLIVNAYVKDIQESGDGKVKILYGDTDSKPII